jgi:hypothetical protein
LCGGIKKSLCQQSKFYAVFKAKMLRFQQEGPVMQAEIFSKAARPV